MAVTSPLSLRPWKKNSLIAWQTINGLISISHFWFAWVLQPIWLIVSLPWTFGQEFLAWGRSLKLIGIFPKAEIFNSRIYYGTLFLKKNLPGNKPCFVQGKNSSSSLQRCRSHLLKFRERGVIDFFVMLFLTRQKMFLVWYTDIVIILPWLSPLCSGSIRVKMLQSSTQAAVVLTKLRLEIINRQ